MNIHEGNHASTKFTCMNYVSLLVCEHPMSLPRGDIVDL